MPNSFITPDQYIKLFHKLLVPAVDALKKNKKTKKAKLKARGINHG